MRRPVLTVFLLTLGLGALLAGAPAALAAPVAVTTSVSLSSGHNPSVAGETVTFTAVVTSNTATPVGRVTFTATGGTMAAATVNTVAGGTTLTSTASTTVTFGLPGSFTVTAAYSPVGDTNGNVAATSNTVTQLVNATATATATPTVTPTRTVTPTMTPTATMTPAMGATTPAAVMPGAAAPVPVGAVGTGGGGSLDGGPSVALLAAGSGLILAGAGAGLAAWRRRRRS